jgi:P27 family predicted phage terminase small subunit
MTRKQSAEIHYLNGNPSNGPDPERRDVRPDPIAPEPPAWMSKRGRAVWTFLAPELEKNALLTKRDREAFAFCCEEAAVAQTALLTLRGPDNNYGNILEIDKSHQNRVRRHPAWIVYTQAVASFRTWAKAFGLTPNARIGLLLGGATAAGPGLGADEDDGDESVFGW